MKTLFLAIFIFSATANAQEHLYDYSIFTNSRMTENYFFSETSSHAPSIIESIKKRLPVDENVFNTPGNSLKLEYVNGKGGYWYANIFKENLRGQDHFNPAALFSFRAYRTATINQNEYPTLQYIFKDSTLSEKINFKIEALKKWTSITTQASSNVNGHSIPGDVIGVRFSQNGEDRQRHTMYFDDIEFVPLNQASVVEAVPSLTGADGYLKHVNITWQSFSDQQVKYVKIYRSENGKNFIPVGIQSPLTNYYSDFTGVTNKKYFYRISFLNYEYEETQLSNQVATSTREMSDEDFLTMIQEACFRYYWDGAESTSGLAKENIPGRKNMIASGASGFGIMALIVGAERKFITRQEAVGRFLKIVNFLERAEKFHGAFSHFIDGPTGKVEPFFGPRDNGGDLVETSFLLQGLIAARAYFSGDNTDEKTIRDKITSIWKNVEWDWYKQFPDSKYLYWHWSPDKGWLINHRLIGWNETMVTYLLAIASPTHPVSADLYYTGWASQDSFAREYRIGWGGTTDGSLYKNGNTYFDIKLKVGVSNGGPLFFTHYSYLGYDPHKITDKYVNYFDNNRDIAMINYRYCLQNPNGYPNYGDSSWGLTAADGPYHYSATEPIRDRDEGKMTPTGAVSSFPYTPEQSMHALKNYYNNYGKFLWGEYGFRDAFNLSTNWCSQIFMGLNQAPMTVMIENYRTDLLWKLFMSDEDIIRGMQKLDAVSKKE